MPLSSRRFAHDPSATEHRYQSNLILPPSPKGILMKETIALFGAGGKMGVRLSRNLLKSNYIVRHVEPSEVGRKRLKDELGLDCIDTDQALDNADVVILAIPDTI